jgi:hypothetical protein
MHPARQHGNPFGSDHTAVAADDSAGMPHAPSRGGGRQAGDKSHHRFGHVGLLGRLHNTLHQYITAQDTAEDIDENAFKVGVTE